MPKVNLAFDLKTRAVRTLAREGWGDPDIAEVLGLSPSRVRAARAAPEAIELSESQVVLRMEARALLKRKGWSDRAIEFATDPSRKGVTGRMMRTRSLFATRAAVLLRTEGWSQRTIAEALALSKQTIGSLLKADAEREEAEAR